MEHDHEFIIVNEGTINPIAEKIIKNYTDNLIGKFRHYSSDKFKIQISGLGYMLDTNNVTISYLLDSLLNFGFSLKFVNPEKHIETLGVVCENVSGKESYDYIYQIQDLPSIFELSSKTSIPVLGIIIMRIVAQTILKYKILYKAIVFDLDDTLWCGTLAEDGIEEIIGNMQSKDGVPFVSFMNFINVVANELGIFIAICSRNDSEKVKLTIEQMGEDIFPLKNQIDCIVANNNDKSENIKEIAKRLSILPEAIIFVDDNQLIRDEVKSKLPNVFVPEWSSHNDLITQLLAGCFFERNELSLDSQVRRRQFQAIEVERKNNQLPKLFIKVFKDSLHEEATRLYAKSNQFKLSQLNRTFSDRTESLFFEIFRQNGENLGICSAITYCTLDNGNFIILNWAISCRYFEIGLEEFILVYMLEKAKQGWIDFIFQSTGKNKKVEELIDKYYGHVVFDDCSSIPNDSNVFVDYISDSSYKQLIAETTNIIGGFQLYSLHEYGESIKMLSSNTNLKLIQNG